MPEYEYWGLMAKTWDLFRGDTSTWADRFFYSELIAQEGQPVLDVGCGSGRLLLDYLQQGIDIDGVDNSPELLALCGAKAAKAGLQPTLYQQGMQALDLPRNYRVILVPSSSFQLVIDASEARQTLARLYAQVRPGGVLAASIMHLWKEGEPLDSGWELAAEAVDPADGATYRRWSRSTFDPANQLESTEDRYEALIDGQVVQSEYHAQAPATRWYSQDETLALFAGAGFETIRLYREFTWEPAQPDDSLFVVVARHPA